MAAFDFNTLLNDPMFQFGTSLLTNSRQPGAVGNAFSQMAKVQQFKKQQEMQQQEQTQLKQWQASQMQHMQQQNVEEALRTKNMESAETRKQALFERQSVNQENLQKMLQGILGGGDTPQPQGDPSQGGAQPNSMMYNMPQGSMPPQQGQDGAPLQNIGNFNPDDPRDPAGPMTGKGRAGEFGGPSAQPNRRPMLKTSLTPDALLNGLAQVESSGNPNAVNPESGAEGMYQFMPGTTAQIRQRNPGFNPRDPKQARGEARNMLENLTARNGGSLERALASYGGFKTKDPSPYIRKVLSAAGAAPDAAPGAPIPAGNGGSNPALKFHQAAILAAAAQGGAGLPGALSDYGKAMQPQHVQPGYERDAKGNMQYIQDPTKVAELAQGNQRINQGQQQIELERERNAQSAAKAEAEVVEKAQGIREKQQKAVQAKQLDVSNYQEKASMMDNLYTQTDALLKHPGLPSNTGLSGVAKIYNLSQSGRDASALMETVKNKLVIDTMMKLKDASKTGSTGFGQLSEKEGERLETYITNLSKAQSLPTMKKALEDIKKFSLEAKGRLGSHIKATYGDDVVDAKPEMGEAPATEEVLTPEQYLAKHAKKGK